MVCLLFGISMEVTSSRLWYTTMCTTQIYGKILPKRICNQVKNSLIIRFIVF